jgi:hypothetical protein
MKPSSVRIVSSPHSLRLSGAQSLHHIDINFRRVTGGNHERDPGKPES